MKTPKDQAGPAPDSLNARVARAIWGAECVRIQKASDTLWTLSTSDLKVDFERSIEDCHRHMLPALEKRGLGMAFAVALTRIAIEQPDYVPGFAVLKLGPRQWCEAFVEVWGEGA